MRLHNFISTKEKRRYLRNHMTESEEVLWGSIKQDALGVRFRRQFSNEEVKNNLNQVIVQIEKALTLD